MIWNRNCRKTRHLLALSAGNDFEERPSPETQRHLAVCPHCREVWLRLRDSQRVLERLCVARFEGESPAVADRSEGPGQLNSGQLNSGQLNSGQLNSGQLNSGQLNSGRVSVWHGVVQHLRVIDRQTAAPNWRGWLPSAALAAACLAIILATIPDSQFGVGTADNRRPFVVYPQPASVGTQGPGFHRVQGAYSGWDRDLPEVGGDSVRILHGDDEPRSF